MGGRLCEGCDKLPLATTARTQKRQHTKEKKWLLQGAAYFLV